MSRQDPTIVCSDHRTPINSRARLPMSRRFASENAAEAGHAINSRARLPMSRPGAHLLRSTAARGFQCRDEQLKSITRPKTINSRARLPILRRRRGRHISAAFISRVGLPMPRPQSPSPHHRTRGAINSRVRLPMLRLFARPSTASQGFQYCDRATMPCSNQQPRRATNAATARRSPIKVFPRRPSTAAWGFDYHDVPWEESALPTIQSTAAWGFKCCAPINSRAGLPVLRLERERAIANQQPRGASNSATEPRPGGGLGPLFAINSRAGLQIPRPDAWHPNSRAGLPMLRRDAVCCSHESVSNQQPRGASNAATSDSLGDPSTAAQGFKCCDV
jgi:hypothetical protein